MTAESKIDDYLDLRKFGQGTFLGIDGDRFLDLSLYQQAKQLGWSHACLEVDEVIKEYARVWLATHPQEYTNYKQAMEKGADLARRRYAECNVVYGLIVEAARKFNPNLYLDLTLSVSRQPNEPDGVHSQKLIPSSHAEKMSPLSTPIGYALPRVIIEQMGRGENNKHRTDKRMLKALNIIDKMVKKAKNPTELVIMLADAFVREDADPKDVLYHLLPANILREENCPSLFHNLIETMEKLSPKLRNLYKSISSQDRQELGIVDF